MQEILSAPENFDAGSVGTRMQLNPFALSAETRGRFRMLVVAALAAALNIGLNWSFLFGREAELKRLWNEHRDLLRQVADATFFKLTPTARETLAERADILIRTMLGIFLGKLLIPIVYVLILSIVAALIYRRHPQRIRRKYKTLPLTKETAPTVVRDLKQMVDALKLSPAPSLEVQALERSRGWKPLDAMAFGLKKSPALLFRAPAEVLEECWKRDPRYKAIALHELAHIKAGDAQNREWARAIWWVLGLLGYLPIALVMLAGRFFAHGSASPLLRLNGIMCAQIVLTFLVLLLIRIDMTWIRELYADGRVAVCGWREPMVAAFRRRSRWHPSAKIRKAYLEKPEKLFRVSNVLPLLTGLLLAFVMGNGLEFGFLLLQILRLPGVRRQWHVFASLVERPAGWQSTFAIVPPMLLGNLLPELTGAVLFFFLARLVSGTLDLQVQRETIADLATGKHENWGYLKLLRPACLLAIGFEAALLLAPNTYFTSVLHWLIPTRATAVTLFSWIWLISMRAFSRFSFGSHAAHESPKQCQAGWFSALIFALLCYPLGEASFLLRIFQNVSAADILLISLPYSVLVLEMHFSAAFQLANTLYILVAGWALVQVSRSLLKVRSCPTCGDRAEPRLVVGRVCRTCSHPLAPWLYPGEADLLKIVSEGEVKQ